MRRNRDLVGAALLAALSAVTVLAGSSLPPAVRLVAAVCLLLLCPGYAMAAAVLAKHRDDLPLTSLLAITGGLCAAVIGGLLLHATTLGLVRPWWVAYVLCLVAAASLVATRRRGAGGTATEMRRPRTRAPVRPLELAFVAAASLVVVAAVVAARAPLPADGVAGYTMLSAVPRASGSSAVVEIRSGELASTTYRLEMRRGTDAVIAFPPVTLAPGETSRTLVSFGSSTDGGGRVSFRLFRAADPDTAYREVVLRAGAG